MGKKGLCQQDFPASGHMLKLYLWDGFPGKHISKYFSKGDNVHV